MSGSATEVVLGTTPKMGRRSMALADIDPKYVSQSGIWEASDVETARGGSIRIQHLTAVSTGPRPLSTTSGCAFQGHHSGAGGSGSGSRFPKLEECAHFHYDIVDLPHLKFAVREDQIQRCLASCSGSEESVHGVVGGEDRDKYFNFSIEVVSGGQCWLFRRTKANWIKLDEQLHRCVWDRNFSRLEDLESSLKKEQNQGSESREVIERYLERLTTLPTNQITCGTVLSWLEIDNRGRHIISSDDAALNTPAVAAALATKTYTAQAPDELSFRIGEMISVIDMPPPEESIWLRGKHTRESTELGINFEVGFFPREFVEIIGEKVKFHSGVAPVQTTRRLARVSVTSTTSSAPIPDKPVLRKHGKIISFFRSMMSRPEKRVLQQKGILRERVFNCDLAEHLLNTGSEIPIILKTCAQFIEVYGISDGIYRVSGSLRNTQRLRRLFDADEVPNLAEDEGIRQDVHAVSSVLKQYFRELPNPLCTYQLYEKFVHAISPPSNKERFDNIKEVIKELPPPHYRTLEYLMLHLSKMTVYSDQTGMTAQNMAIVWAPNLIRCRDLEGGSAAEFKGVSNHVIVTEFVIRYAERFFGKDKTPLPTSSEGTRLGRPESLLLSSSSPMKLMSLEAAKEKLSQNRNYIEVGGGPSSLPPVYHTVIDTSKRRSGAKGKGTPGAPGGWKNFFSRNRSFSKGPRKATASDIRVVMNTALNVKDGTAPGFGNKLRPVRSEESLISTPYETPLGGQGSRTLENTLEVDESGDGDEIQLSTSSPASPVSDAFSLTFNTSSRRDMLPENFEPPSQNLDNPKTHNRSISHDSYFETSMKRLGMIPTEIHEEEPETTSKTSLEMSSSIGEEAATKDRSSAVYGDCDSTSSRATRNRSSFSSTPCTSTASLRPSYLPMLESSSSNEESPAFHSVCLQVKGQGTSIPSSPIIRPKAKPRLSKLRDCQVQTSVTAVNDVGVSTMDEETMTSLETCSSLGESYRLHNSRILDVYQYPTFNEFEKQEVSCGDGYELDRNSSVDDSSTDTTPGFDPYSVTNIVYSPLLNDVSSPTESSSSSEPCSVGKSRETPAAESSTLFIQIPEFEETLPCVLTPKSLNQEENCNMYENVCQLASSEPNQPPVPGTIPFSGLEEVQHYENLESLRQYHQAQHFEQFQQPTSEDSQKREYNEAEFCEEDQHYEHNLKFIDAENKDDFDVLTSEGDSISYDTVQLPTVFSNSETFMEDEVHGAATSNEAEFPAASENDRLGKLVDLASTENSSSPTEDSAYSEELDQDTENNVTYLKIKEASDEPSPEEESAPTFSDPSPVSESEERGFGLDNPLYGIQSAEIDLSQIDDMSQEVRNLSQLYAEEIRPTFKQDSETVSESPRKEKPMTRCNSAPLNDTSHDFALSLVSPDAEGNFDEKDTKSEGTETINANRKVTRTSSMVREQQKLLLCKRLSEPSLNVPKNPDKGGSWNHVDAKRLTHRKQSVRELLNKFESTTTTQEPVSLSPAPSPTRASPLNMNLNNSANLEASVATPGRLPRPVARFHSQGGNNETSSCLRDRNNTRYQHHRFSLGDILISDSLNGQVDDKNALNQSTVVMTRSDTFPELRNEATKENESNSLEYSDKRTIIPEKIVHLFEVANTTVDNSDPNTRERIEKYKNNRRLFLREKYSSGLSKEESELLTTRSVRTSSSSSGGGQTVDRDSSSSIESVFSQLSSGVDRNSNSSSDSPRKRALSEDASLHVSQNQFKTFKSEAEGSSAQLDKDKGQLSKNIPTSTTANIKRLPEVVKGTTVLTGKLDNSHSQLASNIRLNIKSCPPGSLQEGIISVTAAVATVDGPTKCHQHWASSPSIGRPPLPTGESGKKIKDIAAFFERKQF